jgi:hypothetical protein
VNTLFPHRAPADALWLMAARKRGGAHWVANADCEVRQIDIGQHALPATRLQHEHPDASYVASARSAWLRYPQHEAGRLLGNGWAWAGRLASAALLSPCSLLIHKAGLHNAAMLGNHLLSTNLHPDWGLKELLQLQEQAISIYPQQPLILRNICPQLTPKLAQALQREQWQLVPARMVYLCDPSQQEVKQHNHVKRDAKLLAGKDMEVLGPQDIHSSDLPALRELFRQLFIHKYSRLNPDFTPAFFELCLETGFLQLHALRYQGKMAGVLGIYEQDFGHCQRWVTTPLIGYDLALAQELGLHRRLMALLLQQAQQKKAGLHYSSGAASFKKARGGQAQLEYCAIYSRHLGGLRHRANIWFAKLLNDIAPRILARADA